jgi:ATP-binding cassette subfamily B (MDR/TAP) protein 1
MAPPSDEAAVATGGDKSDASTVKSSADDAKKNLPQPVPFSALFQFADGKDLAIFGVGVFFCVISSATMPAINIVFGDIVDSIANPIAVEELVNKSVRALVVMGCYGFITFFLSFYLCGYAATNIANGFRMKYLEALLSQDMLFFDHAEPLSLTLMMSDSAMTIQSGLAEKFAQGIQGLFQFIFGFAIAFYFGPLLAAALLGVVPILALITTAMFMWGEEDGVYGKAAYEAASEIANEAISNIRTVVSLNAEPKMSQRYTAKLGDAEEAAVRQGTRSAVLTGALFFVIFAMYGFGFWLGAILIARSTDDAIEEFPPPDDILDPEGPWYDVIVMACVDYLDNMKALEICACGLPWMTIIEDGLATVSPNCGCGYNLNADAEELGLGVLEGCHSGGRTMMVFFSVLVGGFSVGQIGPGVKAMTDARIAAAKMLAVINRTPDIGDDEDDSEKKRLKRDAVKGEITLENVEFQYSRNSNTKSEEGSSDHDHVDEEMVKTVFSGCNLTMNAGETIALGACVIFNFYFFVSSLSPTKFLTMLCFIPFFSVGESGCGKSTIAKLVQRFYDPTNGRILLDGTDLKDIHVNDLRSCIGVVSQEPILFDATIEDNIRYGKPDASIDDIMEAASSANAHDFIMSFPDGYQTQVGHKGGKLSGGQKQRVAIARAILRDPPILILDEATSALDSRSEKLVQQALDKLIKQEDTTVAARSRTIIVIAHRLSTVRNADTIVVLGSPEGTSTALTGSVILEQGSHDELMQLEKGFYKALVGAGKKSSAGLVDDNTDASTALTKSESRVFTEEDTKSEQARKEAMEKKEEEQGFLSRYILSGKSDEEKAKEEAEKKKLAENKTRVWQYTKPEMGWIIFGACGSMVKGSIWPLLSIVFSEMIVVWYSSDTEYMVEQSLKYSYAFYTFAFVSMVSEGVQKGVFEMIGERLTKRLRGDLFRSMLRKDIMWFEDEGNSVGVLASRLSTDVKLVRLVAGQSVASTLECVSALTTGIIIAATASWQMFLIMLSIVPALAISETLNLVAMKSSEGAIKEQLSQSTNKLHETIYAIREVQSFLLQDLFIDDIEKRIADTIVPASRKAAIGKGVMMGMIQLVQFLVYAVAFWSGGRLIEAGKLTFEDFNKALWAMAFAASGLGQAAVFAGDAAKAAAAVNSIFGTLDFKAGIESEPWENKGIADLQNNEVNFREMPNTTLKEGKGELRKVNFAYPTRKTAKVYDEIDLQIPGGKVVALVGSSGSGKSTVVQLLLRFYDPISYKEKESNGEEPVEIVVDDGALKTNDGIVKIDDKDIREEDIRWLRNNMGYVGQEPVLFNDTIYNNIAMGKDNCTREEVEAAARNANAYDFISNLANGFDTHVGIGGGKVSGGQKQR